MHQVFVAFTLASTYRTLLLLTYGRAVLIQMPLLTHVLLRGSADTAALNPVLLRISQIDEDRKEKRLSH